MAIRKVTRRLQVHADQEGRLEAGEAQDLRGEIAAELCQAFERLGATPDLLARL